MIDDPSDSWSVYQRKLADEQTMADTVAVGSDEEVRQLRKDNAVLVKRIEQLEKWYRTDGDMLGRIAYVLRTFYFAELSMRSIQPLLSLCLELNPEIVEQKR